MDVVIQDIFFCGGVDLLGVVCQNISEKSRHPYPGTRLLAKSSVFSLYLNWNV